MRTRKELTDSVDIKTPTVESWMDHVILGACELEEATTDSERAGVLQCIIIRAQIALRELKRQRMPNIVTEQSAQSPRRWPENK